MVPSADPLLYSPRFVGPPVNQLGPAGAYFALFSEIGLVLLVTTLLGVGAGYWLDGQLGTLPIFVVVGFLLGAGAGGVAIYRLVTRFLDRMDHPPG